ncbi:MAG: hypothetical protein LH702_11045 [Phormidesmis sp. CAN_BIN44]|nr:hypothetical protein [Phormidesmis sp. CAN_BIN44]
MKVLEHSTHRLVLTHQPWDWWLSGVGGMVYLLLCLTFSKPHDRSFWIALSTIGVPLCLYTTLIYAKTLTCTFDKKLRSVSLVRQNLLGSENFLCLIRDVASVEVETTLRRGDPWKRHQTHRLYLVLMSGEKVLLHDMGLTSARSSAWEICRFLGLRPYAEVEQSGWF